MPLDARIAVGQRVIALTAASGTGVVLQGKARRLAFRCRDEDELGRGGEVAARDGVAARVRAQRQPVRVVGASAIEARALGGDGNAVGHAHGVLVRAEIGRAHV